MEDKHFKTRVGALTAILAISCAAAYTTHTQTLTGYVIRTYNAPTRGDVVRRGQQTYARHEAWRSQRSDRVRRSNGIKQLQYTVTNTYLRPAQALVDYAKEQVEEVVEETAPVVEEAIEMPEEILEEEVVYPVEEEVVEVEEEEPMSYRESYEFCKDLELSGTRLTHCIGEMQKDGLVYQLTQSGRR